MSHFVVNLKEPESEVPVKETKDFPAEPQHIAETPKRKSRLGKILKVSGIVIALFLIAAATSGYFYWQYVKGQPQYSLALLVEASRAGDQKLIDELVDTDAVVDSFVPQITNKAIELYGKNLKPQQIAKVSQATAPLIPAIKKRAREEVPRVIDEKTDQFASVPYWAIALGAGRFLDIKIEGETAIVVSKIPERQFELTMKRNGDKWRVVGIRDEALAQRIADTVGQELIAISSREGLKKASEKLGVPDLENIRKKLDSIFGQ